MKYQLQISEDQAVVLIEYFHRFDETGSLRFEHAAEYLALQALAAQIDKTTPKVLGQPGWTTYPRLVNDWPEASKVTCRILWAVGSSRPEDVRRGDVGMSRAPSDKMSYTPSHQECLVA